MSRAALRRAVALLRRDGVGGAAMRVALRLRRASAAAEPLDALASARRYDFTAEDVARSRAVQAAQPGPLAVASVTWFLPYLDNVYYGGLYTVLRLAAQLAAGHGVASTFVAPLAPGAEPAALARLAAAFPALRTARVIPQDDRQIAALPPTDACVATYWTTAYAALRFNQTRRKFYLLQDFEPMFHPAGTLSAQAEATYGFGLYALANTVTLRRIYERDYGGAAVHFTPCVDLGRFRPAAGPPPGPPTVFFYARPGFTRNGFELGAAALRLLKERLGDGVRVVAAGQRWSPRNYGLGEVIESRGVLSLDETAALYRRCAAGLVMMFTRHPSYLPLELMASGSLVVTNRNPANAWLLRDGENCLLAEPSASSIAAALARGLGDPGLRGRITAAALDQIRRDHGDWAAELERLYGAMCGPWPPEGPPR